MSFTLANIADPNVTYFINQIPDISIIDSLGTFLNIENLSDFINITFSAMNATAGINNSICVYSNEISDS